MANRRVPRCTALLSWEAFPLRLISVTGKQSEWPIKQLVQRRAASRAALQSLFGLEINRKRTETCRERG